MNSEERVPEQFVATLMATGAILSPAVRSAFGSVRRHRFLEGWYQLTVKNQHPTYEFVSFNRDEPTAAVLREIYSDRALITGIDGLLPSSSSSEPGLVARMLEMLDLRPGFRVLEIGTGTGYNAALLAEIVGRDGHVSTIEVQAEVAANARRFLQGEGYREVRVVVGDAYTGDPEHAPFNRIEATVGCSDLSLHWLAQLDPDGCMILPLRHGFLDPIVRIVRFPRGNICATGSIVGSAGFMPIQGVLSWHEPWSSYVLPPVNEQPDWTQALPAHFLSQGKEAAGSPLEDPRHRAFQFFLALNSRELFFNGSGYGLADPGTGSRVLLSNEALEGFSGSSTTRLDCLRKRMTDLLDAWQSFNCPQLGDYKLEFVRRCDISSALLEQESVWMIARPEFVEIVRLS